MGLELRAALGLPHPVSQPLHKRYAGQWISHETGLRQWLSSSPILQTCRMGLELRAALGLPHPVSQPLHKRYAGQWISHETGLQRGSQFKPHSANLQDGGA